MLDVLLALADGKRHGWSLVRDIQQRDGGESILPANFYRTLRAIRDDGLIEEATGDSNEDPGERRQYFSLTSLGTKVARAEARRLQALVVDPRARRLLKARGEAMNVSRRSIDGCCGCFRATCTPSSAPRWSVCSWRSCRARVAPAAGVWWRAVVDVLRHGIGRALDRWNRFARLRVRRVRDAEMVDGYLAIRPAARGAAMFRQPGTTAIIVLTLALAIGANTAVFSAVHAVLLKPLPYAEPDTLVMVYEKRAAEGVFDNLGLAGGLSRLGAAESVVLVDRGVQRDRRRSDGRAASRSGWRRRCHRGVLRCVWRARHCTGAPSSPAKTRSAATASSCCRTRCGGSASAPIPAVVGRRIVLNGIPHEVIGVLPADVEFPEAGREIFAPLVLQSGSAEPPSRAAHFLTSMRG